MGAFASIDHIPGRTDNFEERFNRNGDVDRRDGDFRVRISGDPVTSNRANCDKLAKQIVEIVHSEFKGLSIGSYCLSTSITDGVPNEAVLIGGNIRQLPDSNDRILRVLEAIEVGINNISKGCSASVSVNWSNK